MLSFFRKLARSKIFLGTVGVLLLLSLALFGDVRSAFQSIAANNAVVAVGGREISPLEFSQYFDQRREALQEQAGRPVTPAEIAASGGVEQLLSGLSLRESLYAVLERAGVRPSDKLLAQDLGKTQAFQNPVTGKFDRDTYLQALAGKKLNDHQYERSRRDEIRFDHFRYAVAGGLKAPLTLGALDAASQVQTRSYSLFVLNPNALPAPANPTDAQLEAFIKTYADRLKSPERRSLTVVRFSAAALERQVKVDPAEVQTRYNFRKDTLSTPERRTLVQIPAKDAQAAQAAAARLAKGEDPAAVAKAIGVEPVRYDNAPKSAISDAAVANAAFALAKGAVSPPIRGQLGYAVVKVTEIAPGREVTLDEARPLIEAELRTAAAQDRIYEVVQKYEDAHTGGATLKEAARAAGATALDLPPVTAEGIDERGQGQPLLSEKLLKAAFALPEGGESDVEDEGKGEYYAVRVEKVFPSVLPKVAERREVLTQLYLRQERDRLLQQRLTALVGRLNKGEAIDKVAASAGSPVQRQTIDLQTASQDRTERRRLYSAVFSAAPGTAQSVGLVVVRIDGVKLGPLDQAALITATGEQQLRAALYQDMTEQAAAWAAKSLKAKSNPALARQAVNLPAEEDGKAAAK